MAKDSMARKAGKVEKWEKTEKTGKAGGAANTRKLSEKAYRKELDRLSVELVKLQEWVVATGAKVCVLLEGRDGAGKDGTIKAIMERVNSRVFRVVALPAPTEREKSQMYMQRYIERPENPYLA